MGRASGKDITKKLMSCIGSKNLPLDRLIMISSNVPIVNKKVWLQMIDKEKVFERVSEHWNV